jgi:hypothetical protein
MVFINDINHIFETMVLADQDSSKQSCFSANQKQFPADHCQLHILYMVTDQPDVGLHD